MPKVTFVNEHRTVEVEKGRKISEVAKELGIAVCREEFVGTGIGNYTVWVRGEKGSTSEPDWWERFRGVKGEKRFANRTLILGDIQVWTQAALRERFRSPRPIDEPPNASTDKTVPRHPNDAAPTAAFPFGHPSAVGKGERQAIARNTGKPKKAGAAAAVAEPEEEESESDE